MEAKKGWNQVGIRFFRLSREKLAHVGLMLAFASLWRPFRELIPSGNWPTLPPFLASQGAGPAPDWPAWNLREGRFEVAKMPDSGRDWDGLAYRRRVTLLMAYLAAWMSFRRANPKW